MSGAKDDNKEDTRNVENSYGLVQESTLFRAHKKGSRAKQAYKQRQGRDGGEIDVNLI